MIFPLIRLLLFDISRTRLPIFWNIKAYFLLAFLVLKAPLYNFQRILKVTQSPLRVTIFIRSFKFHSDKMYFFLHSCLIFFCFREGGGEKLACYCRGEGRGERKAAKGNNVIHSHILENRLLESKRLVRSAYAWNIKFIVWNGKG